MPDPPRTPNCRIPECDLAPFDLFLHCSDPPQYVLELAREGIEARAAPFAGHGLAGHGGDWAVVAVLAARAEAPDIAAMLTSDRLSLQEHAGHDQGIWDTWFAVTAFEADIGALRRLATLMAALYREPERLARLVHAADPGLFDESYPVLDRFRGQSAASVPEDGF